MHLMRLLARGDLMKLVKLDYSWESYQDNMKIFIQL